MSTGKSKSPARSNRSQDPSKGLHSEIVDTLAETRVVQASLLDETTDPFQILDDTEVQEFSGLSPDAAETLVTSSLALSLDDYDPASPEFQEFALTKSAASDSQLATERARAEFQEASLQVRQASDEFEAMTERAALELAPRFAPEELRRYEEALARQRQAAEDLRVINQEVHGYPPEIDRPEAEALEQGIALTDHPEYRTWIAGEDARRQRWTQASTRYHQARYDTDIELIRMRRRVRPYLQSHDGYHQAFQRQQAAFWNFEQFDQERMSMEITHGQQMSTLQRAYAHLDQSLGGSGIVSNFVTDPDVRASVSAVFKREWQVRDVARLIGARAGDTVRLQPEGEGSFFIEMRRPGDRHIEFHVERSEDTVRIVGPIVENLGSRTSSTGMEIVEAFHGFKELGVNELVATAERSDTYTGYYSWALLGFCGDIPNGALPIVWSRYGRQVTRVEQLMSLPGGRSLWKTYGLPWTAHFSFEDGSHSMRMLERFERRRSAIAVGRSNRDSDLPGS